MAAAIGAFKAFDAALIKYQIPRHRICTIMTGAIATVEATEQGDKDIAELKQAYGGRPFFIVKDEEEAILCGLSTKIEPLGSAPIKKYQRRHKPGRKLVASIGGATLQLCFIEANGEITHPVRILLGIHPLKELSSGRIGKAGRILDKKLKKHFKHPPRIEFMEAAGGMWRTHGEITGKGNLPTQLHSKAIRKTLISRTHRKPSHFVKLLLQREMRSLGKGEQVPSLKVSKILDRADNMPLAAAILRRIAKHFSVGTILFTPTTIRDAMVDQMHRLETGKISAPERGLERLFCLSDPKPASPV